MTDKNIEALRLAVHDVLEGKSILNPVLAPSERDLRVLISGMIDVITEQQKRIEGLEEKFALYLIKPYDAPTRSGKTEVKN